MQTRGKRRPEVAGSAARDSLPRSCCATHMPGAGVCAPTRAALSDQQRSSTRCRRLSCLVRRLALFPEQDGQRFWRLPRGHWARAGDVMAPYANQDERQSVGLSCSAASGVDDVVARWRQVLLSHLCDQDTSPARSQTVGKQRGRTESKCKVSLHTGIASRTQATGHTGRAYCAVPNAGLPGASGQLFPW